MYQKLVNHNEDIGRLVSKGYAIGCDSNYLVVRDVPYLDEHLDLAWGAIVAKLVAVDKLRFVQDDHQVFFAGGVPHGLDGAPIRNLGGGPCSLALSAGAEDVVVQRRFSNKPKNTGKYRDFFDKIDTYVSIISGPAMSMKGADPFTFRVQEDCGPESVFKFHDTLTSRAEITDLSEEFREEIVAVVGLGGTGGYLLDFLVKTPVKEIRAFDADVFHVHNAFRSPGRLDESELGRPKATVYGDRYENFRDGFSSHETFIDEETADLLGGVTFAFVCVDKGSSRSEIFEALTSRGIPFIDVGMGLKRRSGALNGMARVTYFGPKTGRETMGKGYAELSDGPDDLYRTNIQIAELNALNAALAIIRYKQLRGFYFQDKAHEHLLFDLSDLGTVGEVMPDEN
ncbi:ThiF family adenylyltransferase [Roseobacter sinensis]|uniref:ThiF family adenylyltransferase n=1 Tax=Roseobacter sinensis TaxID=2931391 RepID=A0ABT3BKN6_9RHOB|nr:ThiF family adenylyltransferase [Roseobacter sp. WL0113]MCV3274142.1 ThiF family adenylyltransferase [Roseobacter sp. WL0113]